MLSVDVDHNKLSKLTMVLLSCSAGKYFNILEIS